MKKILLYLAIGLLLVAALFVVLGQKNRSPKKVSTWITLSKNDKNPYGAYVFYNSLKNFFPRATITSNTKFIYGNEQLSGQDNGKLYVIMLPFLEISDYELRHIMRFVEQGNNVFVSSFEIGHEFEKYIDVKTGGSYLGLYPLANSGPYNMIQTLERSVFQSSQIFTYPGQIMEGYFFKTDSTIARTLGRGTDGGINFVQLQKGNGNLFIHLSPLAFSNYFLLYKGNQQYFEQIFSLVPGQTKSIVWDEYFISQNDKKSKSQPPNWFRSIMKEPSFRAGILLALLIMLVYTLVEMRRRQRLIPVVKTPVNDSLEFVETIGLLYYQRKDHQNLAQKISAYFMEHVRSRYKIFAREMDENFVKELSYKSGTSEQLVALIVKDIKRVHNDVTISDAELIALQRNIEAFYEKE